MVVHKTPFKMEACASVLQPIRHRQGIRIFRCLDDWLFSGLIVGEINQCERLLPATVQGARDCNQSREVRHTLASYGNVPWDRSGFFVFEGFPSEKEDRRSPEPDLIFFTLRSRLQPLFDYTFLDTGHSGVCWCRGGAEG